MSYKSHHHMIMDWFETNIWKEPKSKAVGHCINPNVNPPAGICGIGFPTFPFMRTKARRSQRYIEGLYLIEIINYRNRIWLVVLAPRSML